MAIKTGLSHISHIKLFPTKFALALNGCPGIFEIHSLYFSICNHSSWKDVFELLYIFLYSGRQTELNKNLGHVCLRFCFAPKWKFHYVIASNFRNEFNFTLENRNETHFSWNYCIVMGLLQVHFGWNGTSCKQPIREIGLSKKKKKILLCKSAEFYTFSRNLDLWFCQQFNSYKEPNE